MALSIRTARLLFRLSLAFAIGCAETPTVVQTCADFGSTLGTFSSTQVDSIAGVVIVGDSVVFVLDGQSGKLWRSALNSPDARLVASHGEGPAEIHLARGLLAWPDGGVLVVEWDGSLLQFNTHGRFVDRHRSAADRGSGHVERQLNWIASDRQGGIYGFSPFERATADSIRIVRCTLNADASCNTVAVASRRFLDPPRKAQISNGKGFSVGTPSSVGQIAVASDGRRLLVSSVSLSVLSTAEDIVFAHIASLERVAVPVTEQDWEDLVAADSMRTAKVIQEGLAVAIASGAKLTDIPQGLRRIARASERPTEFPQLQNSVPLQSPVGSVWIERGHAQRATYRIDILDSLNRYSCRRVPARARIVAVGKDVIVMAIRDAVDVETLRAFGVP